MAEHGTAARYRYGCHCRRCKDAINAVQRAYRAGTQERQREYTRRWNREHPQARRASQKKYYARKVNGEKPVETMPYYRFLEELGHADVF